MLSRAKIIEIEEIIPDHYYLLLENPQVARESVPGQFLHIRVREGLVPFLRRPFSIAGTSPGAGTVAVIFRVAGEGTAILGSLQQGDYLDCLAPLGSGFKTETADGGALSVLVAGGIGVAPLLFLAGTLADEQKKVILFYGASTAKELLPVKKFLPAAVEIRLATDDGSTGYKGLITAFFEEFLKNGLNPGNIYACGPRPMLRALAEINSGQNYVLQLSMEERMACGMGACQGCAVKTIIGDKTGYQLLCRDGPVFYSLEVIW